MLRMSILMHICRGRGLWGVLGDVADVHFDAYLQGSRRGPHGHAVAVGAVDAHLDAYLQGSRPMGRSG